VTDSMYKPRSPAAWGAGRYKVTASFRVRMPTGQASVSVVRIRGPHGDVGAPRTFYLERSVFEGSFEKADGA
jgi:hypothetical protein